MNSHDGLPRWVAVFEEMFADLTEQINSHRWLLCLRESPEPAQQVDFQYGPFTKRFRGTGVRFWFQLDRKRQGFRTGKVLVEIVQTGLVSDLEHWSMADIEEALFFIYQKVGCKFYGRTPYQEENRQRQPSNSSVPRPIIDISYDSSRDDDIDRTYWQQCELWERCFEEEIKRKLFDSVADEWRVEFVKKEPADRAGWEGGRKGLKKVNGEVAFKCPFEEGHNWKSGLGWIGRWYKLERRSHIGVVRIRLYGQKCQKCYKQCPRYEKPKLVAEYQEDEPVCNLLKELLAEIKEHFYKDHLFPIDPPDIRDGGERIVGVRNETESEWKDSFVSLFAKFPNDRWILTFIDGTDRRFIGQDPKNNLRLKFTSPVGWTGPSQLNLQKKRVVLWYALNARQGQVCALILSKENQTGQGVNVQERYVSFEEEEKKYTLEQVRNDVGHYCYGETMRERKPYFAPRRILVGRVPQSNHFRQGCEACKENHCQMSRKRRPNVFRRTVEN